MSYSEFLNRKKINAPKVVATNMALGDASAFTWRRKMAAASVYRPTDHVITNVSDPNVVPDLHTKKPKVYKGTGQGGSVPDASDYTLSRSATALGKDNYSSKKLILGGGSGNVCLASPPASQVINQSGNSDGNSNGLNLGYIASCPAGNFTPGKALNTPVYRPLTKSYFVETIPAIQTDKVGIQGQDAFKGLPNTQSGSQNPLNCKTTSTTGVPKGQIKAEVPHNLNSVGFQKVDFRTGPMGPQVSANGARGRAPKVGAATPNNKYVEKHHGLARPRAWGPRAFILAHGPQPAAPAQLKINSPMHYKVA
jgi:hypothetical protein